MKLHLMKSFNESLEDSSYLMMHPRSSTAEYRCSSPSVVMASQYPPRRCSTKVTHDVISSPTSSCFNAMVGTKYSCGLDVPKYKFLSVFCKKKPNEGRLFTEIQSF